MMLNTTAHRGYTCLSTNIIVSVRLVVWTETADSITNYCCITTVCVCVNNYCIFTSVCVFAANTAQSPHAVLQLKHIDCPSLPLLLISSSTTDIFPSINPPLFLFLPYFPLTHCVLFLSPSVFISIFLPHSCPVKFRQWK